MARRYDKRCVLPAAGGSNAAPRDRRTAAAGDEERVAGRVRGVDLLRNAGIAAVRPDQTRLILIPEGGAVVSVSGRNRRSRRSFGKPRSADLGCRTTGSVQAAYDRGAFDQEHAAAPQCRCAECVAALLQRSRNEACRVSGAWVTAGSAIHAATDATAIPRNPR